VIANDFKSINKILHRQEQKAEFEANNPNVEQSVYGYLHGALAPMVESFSVARGARWVNKSTPKPF